MARENDRGYSLGIMPIPRYVIPPYCGLAVSFPRDVLKEKLSAVYRLGYYASFAVALNEAADIGVSIEQRIKRGNVVQNHYVPLTQTRILLFHELDERLNRFTEFFPDQGEGVRVIRDDFLLLSRHRKHFDPITYLELDSGIIEAGYAAVMFNKESILARAGVNLSGEACNSPEDLLSKYALYLLYSNTDYVPKDKGAQKIQKLHALAMAMKVKDDEEGKVFDGLVGLHNFAIWADKESERTGIPSSEILLGLKEYYIQRSGGIASRVVNRVIAVGSHVSGKVKDVSSRNSINPSDDVWQLSGITRRFHTQKSTVLRHQLEQSNLLRLALS
jgi:hypothetical protein